MCVILRASAASMPAIPDIHSPGATLTGFSGAGDIANFEMSEIGSLEPRRGAVIRQRRWEAATPGPVREEQVLSGEA